MWPQGVDPLIPQTLISRYSAVHSEDAEAESNTPKNRYFCMMDPRDPAVNLGATFTKQSANMIRQAFVSAAKVFRQHISQWFANRQHNKTVLAIFRSTLSRFQMNELPKYSEVKKDELNRLLDSNLPVIVQQIMNASEFDVPDITEDDLVDLVKTVLEENGGVVTVGKMGSLMHAATNNHSLPAMLKAKYGGLKKLLRRHPETFFIANDHPHNPRVYLRGHMPDILTTESISGSAFEADSRDAIDRTENQVSINSRTDSPTKASLDNFHSSSLNQIIPQTQVNQDESLVIPEMFKCPISKQVFFEPVVASDGYTYERVSLEKWIEENGSISPMTRERLNFPFSYPNSALSWAIEQFHRGNLTMKAEK